MEIDENDVMEEEEVEEEAAEEAAPPDIGLVLGALDDDRRASIQEQLDVADKRLAELTATLTERSGRDTWATSGVHVELYESGQAMIAGVVDDPAEGITFNVELRPSNFFDEQRPWRPGEAPRPMATNAWDVEGEALVLKVTKVSGRKYTITESAAELEEQRHDTPEAAVAAFVGYVDDLAELALSRDPVAASWQSDIEEYGTPPPDDEPHEFVSDE